VYRGLSKINLDALSKIINIDEIGVAAIYLTRFFCEDKPLARGKAEVFGFPGCVMYSRTTIIDLLLSRILVGKTVIRQDNVRLANGNPAQSVTLVGISSVHSGKVIIGINRGERVDRA
jgi:hypothetical protein